MHVSGVAILVLGYLVTAGGALAQGKGEQASFPAPLLGNVAVDWCRTYGADCGQPAADLFCQSQGYDRAGGWSTQYVSDTIVLGTMQRCTGGGCGALTGVTCLRGAALPSTGLVPLKLYWNPARGDNLTAASADSEAAAIAAGYGFVRIEGYAFASEQPGTVPLWSFWGADREDSMAATAVGAPAAQAAGYQQVRIEAWVYPTQVAGTVPLNTWWGAQRGDNFATATAAGEADAIAAGYGFAWTEGYVFPP